jgi:hypothetical protein
MEMMREEAESAAWTPPFRWATFTVSVACVVCAVALLWTWIPPAYDTNDDVTIRRVLEGTRVPGQPPTGFALLPHAALGWALVAVRDVRPSVYAWDLAVTGTLAWGVAVFVTLVWGAPGSGRVPRLSSAIVAVAAVLPLVSSVQYTLSATMAGGAATLLAWSELEGHAVRRHGVLAMAVALLVLALLVRSGGAMAGSLAVVACLVARALLAGRRGLVTLTGVTVGALALSAVLYAADVAIYRTHPQWDAYRQMNELVTALFDWNWQALLPSEVNITATRQSVGWTTGDWTMLEQAWAVDPERFSLAAVREFSRTTMAHLTPLDYVSAATQRLWMFDRANWLERWDEAWPALLGAALVLLTCSRAGDRRMTLAIVMCFVVYCVAVQVGFKSLPFRLLAPMIACFVGVLLSTARLRPVGRVPAACLLLIVGTLAAYQARAVFDAMASNHRHSLQVDAEGAALAALHPSLVVIHRDRFPEEHWFRPFHTPRTRLLTIRLGRNNQNPQLLSFLEQSGLSTFPSAICDNPSILVVSDPGRLDVLTTDLQEREGRSVTWRPVLEGSFTAWQCLPGTASDPAA